MKKYVVLLILMTAVIFQGCAKNSNSKLAEVEDSKPVVSGEVGEEEESMNKTGEVTGEHTGGSTENSSEEGALNETATEVSEATPSPEAELVLPLVENVTGKVLIQTVSKSRTYPYNSYIITSVDGESVVLDPTEMPKVSLVDLNPAAIGITHSHPDHNDPIFLQAYECPTIKYVKGEIATKDFLMYSILSSHSNDSIVEANKNVILVLEVDGLRIAHMGDIGQTVLTQEQIEELGDIDIAFMQFENSYSTMSLENGKGFALIEQLNPKIIIPTHYTEKALPMLEEKYGTISEYENILEITQKELPANTMTVYRILNNHKY